MRYFFTGTIIAAILTTAILMTFSFTETAFAAQGTGSACGKGGCTPNTGGSESGSGFNGGIASGGSLSHDSIGAGSGNTGNEHCGSGSGSHDGVTHGGGSC
jgi:hypothetical protein